MGTSWQGAVRSRCSYEQPRKTRTLSRRQAPCSVPCLRRDSCCGSKSWRFVLRIACDPLPRNLFTDCKLLTNCHGRNCGSGNRVVYRNGGADRKSRQREKIFGGDLCTLRRQRLHISLNDRGEPGISPVIGDGRSQDIEIHTGFQKSSKDIRLFRIMADPGSHRLSCKGGSKTLAAERREVEGQPRILPPACRSFPIRKEKRASPVRACIFGAAGSLRLFGLHRFFKRGDGKGRKARSAQPVSKDKERNHGYGHICKSGNINLCHTGRVDQRL